MPTQKSSEFQDSYWASFAFQIDSGGMWVMQHGKMCWVATSVLRSFLGMIEGHENIGLAFDALGFRKPQEDSHVGLSDVTKT